MINLIPENWYPYLFYIPAGLGITLGCTILSLLGGLLLGTGLALCRVSRIAILDRLSQLYISIFRGTPLLVQLSIIYFATPGIIGYKLSPFTSAVLAFGCNSAAYIAEIIRAGINAVPKGQFEAARSLGIPYTAMMKDIILPQAMRNILPALANEAIALLKETAIIAFIGGADLMYRARAVSAEHYIYFPPYITAGICYYIAVTLLSYGAKKLELHLSKGV